MGGKNEFMKQYRFSPIKNKKTLFESYEYIVSELEKLSQMIFGKALPITVLKVFPHYLVEYEDLYKIIAELGSPAEFNSATSFYAKVNENIKGFGIDYLGIRIVDPYRLQVGCGDYEIENFKDFKHEYLNKSPYVRQFSDKDMLEVWHPDFDVLGYVIPKEI